MSLALLVLAAAGAAAQSQDPILDPYVRSGPAANPESHPDWGGTPDPDVSRGTGLRSAEIRAILDRIGPQNIPERKRAIEALSRDARGSEQAFREVLWARHAATNAEMKQAVLEAERRLERAGAGSASGGLLARLVEMTPADPVLSRGTVAALRIVAMLDALAGLDTLAGYKVMLEFSPRHAGVFRREIGRMIMSRGMDAMPALVYGRGSSNPEIHMFSVAWIREMGQPSLGEQLKIENPRRLAQLLEAYASVNELDAIDVTLSLANHESAFVRNAARKCLRLYGANAKWALRRVYENTFGEIPPDAADPASLLTRLCQHWDQERLAPLMSLFEQGLAFFREGRLDEMSEAFRRVLREAPLFPRRSEMAPGFLALASRFRDGGDDAGAREAVSLARRLAANGSDDWRRAEAAIRFRLAEDLRRGGAPDSTIYGEVASLDPENDEARGWQERLEGRRPGTGEVAAKTAMVAYLVLLAAWIVARRLGAFGHR